MSELSDMIGTVCVGREKLLTMEETHKVVEYMRYLNKFMEMWEDLENLMECDRSDFYKDQMRFIKQKYFPQPVKKVITIEVEARNKDSFNWFKNYIMDFQDKTSKGNLKVNIKEEK